MTLLKLMLLTATLFTFTNVFAAIDCKPHMDCSQPRPPAKPPVPPENKYRIMSTVQIKSPDCKQADLLEAINEAKIQNLQKAQEYLGTTRIVAISEPHIQRSCTTSIYDRSSDLWWTVHVFINYKIEI